MRRIDFTPRSSFLTPLAPRAPEARQATARWLPVRDLDQGPLVPLRAGRLEMAIWQVAVIALVAAGAIGIVSSNLGVIRDTGATQPAAREPAIRDDETIDVPSVLGIAALATGGLLLFLPSRKD